MTYELKSDTLINDYIKRYDDQTYLAEYKQVLEKFLKQQNIYIMTDDDIQYNKKTVFTFKKYQQIQKVITELQVIQNQQLNNAYQLVNGQEKTMINDKVIKTTNIINGILNFEHYINQKIYEQKQYEYNDNLNKILKDLKGIQTQIKQSTNEKDSKNLFQQYQQLQQHYNRFIMLKQEEFIQVVDKIYISQKIHSELMKGGFPLTFEQLYIQFVDQINVNSDTLIGGEKFQNQKSKMIQLDYNQDIKIPLQQTLQSLQRGLKRCISDKSNENLDKIYANKQKLSTKLFNYGLFTKSQISSLQK